MTQKFDLHIRVESARKAATIMELLDGEARLLDMKEVPNGPRRRTEKTFEYAGGKRLKGVTGVELIKRIVADGRKHSRVEVMQIFQRNSFAEGSVPATISQARRQGAIESDKTHVWLNKAP